LRLGVEIFPAGIDVWGSDGMSTRETWKPDWRLTFDLNLTSRLTRSCANLLRDHPDDDVTEAMLTLLVVADTLDAALERVPASLRETVNATLAQHRIDVN
jgi:hypothetical protein